jgi:class 3 adenylate cyclase
MIRRNLTVCFADLDGWIKLNELIGEEKAIQSLLIKFREIEKIIKSQNGKIRKFIGDFIFI